MENGGRKEKGPGMSTGRRENTQLMDLFGMYQKEEKREARVDVKCEGNSWVWRVAPAAAAAVCVCGGGGDPG